ncbi:MAG: hypothetical protein LBF63_11340, partial [Treponema sp.]|nr:hypothetical protein [Treponema sp.]
MSDDFLPTSLFDQEREAFLGRQRTALAGMADERAQEQAQAKVQYTPEQYRELRDRAERGEIDEDEMWRIHSSMAISEYFNIPLTEARKNIEPYTRAITGNLSEAVPKKWFAGITAAFATIPLERELRREVRRLRELETNNGDPDLIRSTYGRLGDLERQIEQNTDVNANPVVRAFEGAIKSSPHSLYVGAARAVGTIAGGRIGGAVLGTLAGAERQTDLEYYSLRKAGIDIDIADNIAPLSGTVQGAIESFLDQGVGLVAKGLGWLGGKTLSVPLSDKITSLVLSGMRKDGVFLNWAAKNGIQGLAKMGVEGGEEAAETLSGSLFHNLAATLQNERVYTEVLAELKAGGMEDGEAREHLNGMITALRSGGELPDSEAADVLKDRYVYQKKLGEIVKELGAAFFEGALVASVYGLADVAISSKTTLSDLRRIRAEAAATPSEQAFYEKVKDEQAFSHLPEAAKKASAAKLYGAVRGQLEREEARVAAEEEQLRKSRLYSGVDTSGDPVYHDAGGNLYAENIRHTDSGGALTGVYQGGNPQKAENNLYWKLDYRMDGDEALIEGLRVGENYESLKPEILQNFANDMGQAVSWEGVTYNPVEGAVKAVHIGFGKEIRKTPENAVESSSRTSDGVLKPLAGKENAFFDKIRALPNISSDLEARAGVEAQRMNAALNYQTLEEHLENDFDPE